MLKPEWLRLYIYDRPWLFLLIMAVIISAGLALRIWIGGPSLFHLL